MLLLNVLYQVCECIQQYRSAELSHSMQAPITCVTIFFNARASPSVKYYTSNSCLIWAVSGTYSISIGLLGRSHSLEESDQLHWISHRRLKANCVGFFASGSMWRKRFRHILGHLVNGYVMPLLEGPQAYKCIELHIRVEIQNGWVNTPASAL